MLTKRLIACLDVKDNVVVKGKQFENLIYGGDPVELAKRYAQIGIDELVFLDISATYEKRKTLIQLVEKVAEQINIPFTVGGGINSLELASELIYKGADKVSINTAAVENPKLITQIADRFGLQAVVVAVDVKKTDIGYEVFTVSGRKRTGIRYEDYLVEVEKRGAGELLITSIDKDGTQDGYDVETVRLAKSLTKLPVIASGGAGKMEHVLEILTAGADAALMASVLHFEKINLQKLKEFLQNNGIKVRINY
ncbi:MAG: imidazole glycerol phosphate synthase subunit HisF [Fervidobacterium sp.]|nr:imidazole glycerol phosphate synthase subunit HisF [Fervidobacterium sp.]